MSQTPFRYHRATSVADASSLLAASDARPLGGGTDLLVSLEEGLEHAGLLVDLRSIPEGDTITALPGGALRIGAATRIDTLANDARVNAHFPALAQACAAVGTPALRNMGTLGGNLCQRPRCWYLRRAVPCHKNGGDSCPARDGENQYLAILDGGPCFIVHPSDPAVALSALEAVIEVAGPAGSRRVHIADFYVLPSERLGRETVLADDEFIVAIELPAHSAGGRQLYRKLMQRDAWDFALVSIAAVRRTDGDVRLFMGGVAPRPYRVNSSVEEDIASGGLDEDSMSALAQRAMYDAEPLSKNSYKVALAESLLRDAMRELGA
ncbi:MAG: carbon monoxide dehydrogenase, FAD-binding subunit [Gemmatimonadetes bacterium]|nr:carbon monoxide dehydrogenase, FAD-binding subunit [Gemmatimonadota bacterium]